MKTITSLICVTFVLALGAPLVMAEAEAEGGAGADAPRRESKVTGRFDRLLEQRVGDREYVGVVLNPMEGRGWATLLVGRDKKDMLDTARKLQRGQVVTIAYVSEGGSNFAQRLEVQRSEAGGDREKPAGDGDKAAPDRPRETPREGADRPRDGADRPRETPREGADRPRPEGDRPDTERGGDRPRPEAGDRPRPDSPDMNIVEHVRKLEQRIEQLEARIRELEQANRRPREGRGADR